MVWGADLSGDRYGLGGTDPQVGRPILSVEEADECIGMFLLNDSQRTVCKEALSSSAELS